MMTTTQGIKEHISISQFLPALMMSTFFCASVPSGPVFNGIDTWNQLKEKNTPEYRTGLFKLLEGTTYIFAISGMISLLLHFVSILQTQIVFSNNIVAYVIIVVFAKPMVSFGFLFASFYGYSRMAEGSAALFGFYVPENFNKPHLAKDLADFWKRWHCSMAKFVIQYIYLPLLVSTSQAKLALTVSFIFMGIWHNFSLSFLLWGIGHGIGLAYLLPFAKKKKASPKLLRIGSLVYVVFFSSIAHEIWFP